MDGVKEASVGVHLRLPPAGPAALFHLKTPVDAKDGTQHLEAPTPQRHLIDLQVNFQVGVQVYFEGDVQVNGTAARWPGQCSHLCVSGETVTEETFIVGRYVITGHVERLVEELVVGHIVTDDHLLRFRCLAPSD